MSNTESAVQYFEAHRRDYLDDLKHLVRIPSVSFPGFDHSHMRVSAQATADLMKKRGFTKVEILELEGAHPYVLGEVIVDPKAPTVLLYAHHDVQPAGDVNVWTSPPFEPTERKERLYGRGSADDKAGITVHTSAVDAWTKATGKLPLNLKFLVEGEEEVGSANLMKFLHKHIGRLKADALLLTDTANIETGIPSITNALRGLVTVDVEVRALKGPVHSGLWGGPLPDPAMALARMLASLTREDGSVALPGFYEKVRPLTADEQKSLASMPVDVETVRKQVGILDGVPFLTKGNVFEAMWRRPTIAINAMQASSRADARNIVVDSAWARVGIRIVPDMDGREVQRSLVEHLKKSVPWGLTLHVHEHTPGAAWYGSTEHPAFKATARSLEKGFGRAPTILGSGGSIPFVGPFCEALGGIPALLIGIEDPYSNPHGIDESLSITDYEKVTRSSIYLYEELARTLGR